MILVALVGLLLLALSPAAGLAAEGDGEAVQGTIQNADGDPVPGVQVQVFDGDELIGQAESADSGEWLIRLPGPGTYSVRLDADSLPDRIQLRDPNRTSLEVEVRSGQSRTLLFPLGERSAAGLSSFTRIAQALVNGLAFGLIIAMTALGLSLVYGTTQMINFAHGEMVTLGAVLAWVLSAMGMPFGFAVMASVALGAIGGGLMERLLWRPLRQENAGLVQLLVISIGVSLVLRHLILLFFGSQPRPFTAFTVQSSLNFGGVLITPRDLVILVVSLTILVGIGLILTRTRVGLRIRAVADDRDLAESSGIDIRRVILLIWIVAGGLAAVGGVMLGLSETVDWLMGFRLLLIMFSAIILGGMGAPFGAMVGGVIVGVVTELSTIVAPAELKIIWGLVALVLVLLVRPQGIFGRAERYG